MYSSNIKTLHLEPSQLCNASCSVCNRRLNGGPKNPNIKDVYATLDQVQSWFSSEFIRGLDRLILCGNYGDPMTNPELLEIVSYFREHAPTLYITMHTNASGRDWDWWNRLGKLIGSHGDVYFSIDGLEDTNHIYRRGTRWKPIMDAVDGYIASGARAIWDYLIFRHNQHQVAEAEAMSLKLGFSKFIKKTAFGFDGDHPITVLKDNGAFDYYIYPKDSVGERDPGTWMHDVSSVFDMKAPADITKLSYNKELDTAHIDCMASRGSEIYVNAYGLLFPCCFTAGKWQGDRGFVNAQFREFVNKYGADSMDLNKHNINDIINTTMFTHGYRESWNCTNIANGKLLVCAEFCGKYNTNVFDKIQQDHARD